MCTCHACVDVCVHARMCVCVYNRGTPTERQLPAMSTYCVPARAKTVCGFSHCSHPHSIVVNIPILQDEETEVQGGREHL